LAVVVEEVDLIAEQPGMQPGANPLLFQLLNEMDGLGEDVDVAFVLRRSALLAANDAGESDGEVLVVGQRHLHAALDELLDDRARLTRVILGG
jgi:hypothetical protein